MEFIDERFGLVMDRIRETVQEDTFGEPLLSFFATCSDLLIFLSDILKRSLSGKTDKLTVKELSEENHRLYADITGPSYEESFANPDFIVGKFEEADIPDAKALARYLCFVLAELRGLIPYAYEGREEIFTVYTEFYMEVYTLFRFNALEGSYPDADAVRDIIYWFESDNCDIIIPDNVADKIDPSNDFLKRIVTDEDLTTERFLYLSGEYVTDNERGVAKFLNGLPEEDIKAMADTFTEGYRIGFVKAGKPIEKKKTVNIRYRLGFERVIRAAMANFEKMGLETVIYRAGSLSLTGAGVYRNGFYGAIPNRQYDYDHKDDPAIYLDGDLVERKLGVLAKSYEERKTLANGHAGPAVMEVFGEEPFTPVVKESAVHHSDKTGKLAVDYAAKASVIINKYIIPEERSFTIIAYPAPEIGKDFEKIFADTVKLNTLPYEKYEKIQQSIIDVLDKAECVEIKGKDDNVTDLRIMLHPLSDPEKETKFENCVADVNIPVGEVFTSPQLKGTNGVLHVTKVFLNGLLYKDLRITFADGMITDYSCANYEDAEENRRFIKDNILHKHESLPIGEFAIGTNTTAYRMGRDYDIEGRLPILIGEKTGPHFAVGDTCYSHEEDVRVFNPDGKEIIAKENEVSKKRTKNIKEA